MPAYPFAQLPTLREFVERAQREHGATREELTEAQVVGPQGKMTLRYLRREDSAGRVYVALLPEIGMSERLTPSVLRSLCRQLGIPSQLFGIDFF